MGIVARVVVAERRTVRELVCFEQSCRRVGEAPATVLGGQTLLGQAAAEVVLQVGDVEDVFGVARARSRPEQFGVAAVDGVVTVVDDFLPRGCGFGPILLQHVGSAQESQCGLLAGTARFCRWDVLEAGQSVGGFAELGGAPSQDVGLRLLLHVVGLFTGQRSRYQGHILEVAGQVVVLRGAEEACFGYHARLDLGVSKALDAFQEAVALADAVVGRPPVVDDEVVAVQQFAAGNLEERVVLASAVKGIVREVLHEQQAVVGPEVRYVVFQSVGDAAAIQGGQSQFGIFLVRPEVVFGQGRQRVTFQVARGERQGCCHGDVCECLDCFHLCLKIEC